MHALCWLGKQALSMWILRSPCKNPTEKRSLLAPHWCSVWKSASCLGVGLEIKPKSKSIWTRAAHGLWNVTAGTCSSHLRHNFLYPTGRWVLPCPKSEAWDQFPHRLRHQSIGWDCCRTSRWASTTMGIRSWPILGRRRWMLLSTSGSRVDLLGLRIS